MALLSVNQTGSPEVSDLNDHDSDPVGRDTEFKFQLKLLLIPLRS